MPTRTASARKFLIGSMARCCRASARAAALWRSAPGFITRTCSLSSRPVGATRSAIAEEGDDLGRAPGTYLWADQPESYPYAEILRQTREVLPPLVWSSLYMNRPTPETGDFFKAEFFKPMTVLPAPDRMHVFGASDYAVSSGRGDWTVHLVVGLDTSGQLHLLDCWRKQAATDEGVDAFLDLVKRWRPLGWACEKGQLANAIEPFLISRQRERRIFVAMEMFPTRGDKAIRCQSIRGRLAVGGGILVPTHAEWWPDARAELLSAFAGAHDDCADALGLIGQILDRMSAPSVLAPPKPRKLLSTDPALCNISLTELFEANERRHQKSGRI
jgi:predicted phage terminase large subunit-like protein